MKPSRLLTAKSAVASALLLTFPAQAQERTSGNSIVARSTEIHAREYPLVREIDERFQSFQIGMSHLTGGDTWRSYDDLVAGDGLGNREIRHPADLSNGKLRTLVSALAPLYIRFGGTTSNSVYFQDDEEPKLAEAPEGFTRVLTRAAWRDALDFARAVDAKVVTGFAVSSGVRDSAGVWTRSMAAPWLAYTQSIGGEIYAAEMFNEPNAAADGNTGGDYGASGFARDCAVFRPFIKSMAPALKIAGPGDARIATPVAVATLEQVSADDFLSASPRPQFDIISYHLYPALSLRCAPETSALGVSPTAYLSEDFLSRPDKELERRKDLRDKYAPGAPIWNTETGGAACGGVPWQTDFLEALRFLDAQARTAKHGLDASFTHALISGSNGVIDERTYVPNASYWAALLWRKLLGTRVLDAGELEPGLHIYAHCLREDPGAVAIMAINLLQTPARLELTGPADVYALSTRDLRSRTVLLNNKPLELGFDDSLPAITPVRTSDNETVVSPTSVSFVVLPEANNPSCTV